MAMVYDYLSHTYISMSETAGPNPEITEEAIRILEATNAERIILLLLGGVENPSRTWTGLAMLFDRLFYPRLARRLQ